MNAKIPESFGYCGLNCHTCPIYLATRIEDKAEQLNARTEIARMCREEYRLMYNVEDITDCDGCSTKTEILFPGCSQCGIRNCALERGFESCALCPDYACDILKEFYIKDPTARTALEEIRKSLNKIY
jgi:Protein of unknown function (DUF3795)